MQKLVLTVPAGVGETPTSFAARLAARNFVSARDLLRDFGLSFQDVVDGDEHTIRRLADLGGAEFECLKRNSIHKVGMMYSLNGQTITKPGIRRRRVHLCPVCIQDDIAASILAPGLAAYGRSEWAIEAIRTCARHSVALVEVKNDIRSSELHDFTRNIMDRIPDMDRLARNVRRRPASGLETYLLGRIEGRTNYPWLDRLPFFVAAYTTELFGAVSQFGKGVNLRSLTDDDLYQAGAAGFEITASGAAGIDHFMTKLKSEHVRKNDRSVDGLQATYGKLYVPFAQGLSDAGYDPVREAMAEHILAQFPLGPGDELFGKPVETRRFHSIRTAALAYKMHSKRLRKLVDAEGLIPAPSVKDRDVLLDAAVADRLFERERNAITAKQAEQYINAPRGLPKALCDAGIIPRHSVGSAMNNVYLESELDAFLIRLFRKAKKVKSAGPQACDMAAACRRANCSVLEIIRLIIDDQIAWVGRRADAKGLAAILVDSDEIRALTRLPDLCGLIYQDAIRTLHVSGTVMAGLVRAGALKTVVQRHPVKRNPQVVIPLEEIGRFKSMYVSLHQLARERGKYMGTLNRELQEAGVRPTPELDGVGASFFKRSDLPP
ncbi:TniQ family protein [Bradyrhizobium sp. Arg62]|uniref:TniQ family protein n=1 Tax=Bradyrhizobium brasilense TaxID=1419277 RepID=UPI001E3381E0|nr:TniQ family protein [Bradyrhizobium brasilense]MCC8944188.1 TniQ family protein [Bradyrhizobium brasilense]